MFTNKIPVKTVMENKVGERWQIEIIQINGELVEFQRKVSIVHARFIITNSLSESL